MKTSHNTIKGIYADLREIFTLQFQEFVKQFIESDVDLDAFFDSAELDIDFLNTIINDWCEQENPSIEDTIKCLSAIFMLAFIEKVDKETATIETQSEETSSTGPLD